MNVVIINTLQLRVDAYKMFAWNALLLYVSYMIATSSGYKQYCVPENTTCWPTAQEWKAFGQTLEGKLHQLMADDYPACVEKGDDAFKISNTSFGACMQYHDCSKEFCDSESKWNLPSYSAEVKNTRDVQKVIAFANKYDIEVTVKTSGHSYSGSSMGRNSLLIWMYNFVKYDEIKTNFMDTCSTSYPYAIKVGGGETWYDVYKKLGPDYHIVGGGGLTVSAAGGWLQGCGLSALSRKYGIGIDTYIIYLVAHISKWNSAHVVDTLGHSSFWHTNIM